MTTPAPGAATPAKPNTPAPAAQPAAAPALPGTGAPAPAASPAAVPGESLAALAVARRKLERELAALQPQVAEGKKALEQLAKLKDPKSRWAAAQEMGLSYEDYTQHVLGSLEDDKPKLDLPPDVLAKLAEIDELKAEREAERTAGTEAQRKLQHKEDVDTAKGILATNKDKFPFMQALGHEALLVSEFNRQTAENGEPADPLAIAASIESSIAKTLETQLTQLAATEPGKALLAKLLGQPANEPGKPQLGTRISATLTNTDASTPGDRPDLRKLTDAERKQRGIEAMRRAQ